MADINPFASPPVFRYEDVVTVADLAAIREGYYLQLQQIPWYRVMKKFNFLVAITTIDAVFDWILHGKPIRIKKDGNNEKNK